MSFKNTRKLNRKSESYCKSGESNIEVLFIGNQCQFTKRFVILWLIRVAIGSDNQQTKQPGSKLYT